MRGKTRDKKSEYNVPKYLPRKYRPYASAKEDAYMDNDSGTEECTIDHTKNRNNLSPRLNATSLEIVFTAMMLKLTKSDDK